MIKAIFYCVKNEHGNIIGKDLNLDNAMIFIRALFETYFADENISYTIERQKGGGMKNDDYFWLPGFLCGVMAGIAFIAIALLIAEKLGCS